MSLSADLTRIYFKVCAQMLAEKHAQRRLLEENKFPQKSEGGCCYVFD